MTVYIDRLVLSLFGNFFDNYVNNNNIELYFHDYLQVYGHISKVDRNSQNLITREVIEIELNLFLSLNPGMLYNDVTLLFIKSYIFIPSHYHNKYFKITLMTLFQSFAIYFFLSVILINFLNRLSKAYSNNSKYSCTPLEK